MRGSMRMISTKIVLLTLYLGSLMVVQNTLEFTTGFSVLVVLGVLSYCGIIVVAHSVAALYVLCRWLSRQLAMAEQQLPAAVALDAETEAT